MDDPRFDSYADSFEHVALTRDGDGILEVRLHTDGGPLVWGDSPHSDLVQAFTTIGADPGNRVIILTGTGGRFIADLDDSWVGAMHPQKWDRLMTHGRRLLQRLLELPVPVIAAVNGPASVHPELAAVSDIVLASDTAYFSDAPHFKFGVVPGDGAQIIWPLLLGQNRGRYFLLTAQRIHAQEALDLGVVSEVLPEDQLMDRAREHARNLARHPDVVLRYTREACINHIKRLVADELPLGLALAGLGTYANWPE